MLKVLKDLIKLKLTVHFVLIGPNLTLFFQLEKNFPKQLEFLLQEHPLKQKRSFQVILQLAQSEILSEIIGNNEFYFVL